MNGIQQHSMGANPLAANKDGTTPQDDFATWCAAAQSVQSSHLGSLLPLWSAMEMEATLPSSLPQPSRLRL